MSKGGAEVDCMRRCKSRSHGQVLTSAITKRSISDEALASFIKGTCANFTQAFDFEGRTALHMAASRGRNGLMEWLARHSSEAFVNARDRESGYTPLHRSVFYGQIHSAVALMKMGVKTDILDKDDYKALEHAMLDRHYMYKHVGAQPSDLYVWGTNSNYTLGTSTQQQRTSPDLLTCFARTNTSVLQACLGKFHSVFVCSSGGENTAWCCGQVSRAGAPATTALHPVCLRLPEPCLQAAVTYASTVFLMQSGTVLQYTLNSTDNASQSGSKTPSSVKLPNIKPLKKISDPIGVCASRTHAVVWNAKAAYSWGTNLGQLGHSQGDKIVQAPRKIAILLNIKEETTYQLVAASDAATLLTTSRGDVYLLHKHICKKIATKEINLRQVCVEAKVSDQGVYSRVTVLLLTAHGKLLIWQDTTNTLTRCVFGLIHQTTVTHVALTHDALYFTTNHGEAFVGTISRKAPPTQPQPIRRGREKDEDKSALVKFLEKNDCTLVRITKIPNIHRAVSIAVDSEGLNFACLQIKPTCGLTSLPQLSPSSLTKHMESLLETASDYDILHDVIFKVGTKLYPAHIFIVASGSDYLYKLYHERRKTEEKPVIPLENVHWEVFDRILRFLYTGTCDVAELGACKLKLRKDDLNAGKKDKDDFEVEVEAIENPLEISAFEAYRKQSSKSKKNSRRNIETPPRSLYLDPVKLVQAAAKRLQVMALHKLLDKFYYKNGIICLKDSATLNKNAPASWDRSSYPELVDTNVCSKDGILIPAHKCVLAARLEYFNAMFINPWTESTALSTVTLPINHGILLPIIDFLYTDSCPEIECSSSIDFICSMLIVTDQLFINRMREMCEVALGSLVNLRNCAELCQFAHTYNASQLKQCCMEFISLNICCMLENKALDFLEEELLEDISKYYCKFNPIMSARMITPFFNAVSDETIIEVAKTYPVKLETTDEDCKKDSSMTEDLKITKKGKSKKIEYTENEKARMRYESVSSVASLDLSHDTSGDITLSLSKISKESEKEKKDKWIEVPSSQQKQQKVVQARLKAISTAKDIMNESPVESFTMLTKANSSGAITGFNVPESSITRMSVSPKESPIAEMARSTQGSMTISHIGPKLSQKQRKKLAMQGSDCNFQNLNDYFANKDTIVSLSTPSIPRNPWKICEPPAASSSPNKPRTSMEFNQILADQKKQKDDFSRIMTKPLILTQLEDKAIEELERFYNAHESDEEWITVRRIELLVPSPQWINTALK